jgi:hypothetical protein
MTDHTNGQRLAQFIAAFEQGNVERQRSLIHPDAIFHSPESLPYGGQWHGTAGWQAMKKAISAVWSELDLKIRHVVGAQDAECFVVIADLIARSRHTNLVYESEVMEKWIWRDGLLALVQPYYWDTARVKQVIDAT